MLQCAHDFDLPDEAVVLGSIADTTRREAWTWMTPRPWAARGNRIVAAGVALVIIDTVRDDDRSAHLSKARGKPAISSPADHRAGRRLKCLILG